MAKKNKPNKIKVVIDRPKIMEPGEYHAETIGCEIHEGKIILVIRMKTDVKL